MYILGQRLVSRQKKVCFLSQQMALVSNSLNKDKIAHVPKPQYFMAINCHKINRLLISDLLRMIFELQVDAQEKIFTPRIQS